MDLLTFLAIVDTAATIIGTGFAYLTYRRTPKPLVPPVTPVSAAFYVVKMPEPPSLPGYGHGASRMGFGRFRKYPPMWAS